MFCLFGCYFGCLAKVFSQKKGDVRRRHSRPSSLLVPWCQLGVSGPFKDTNRTSVVEGFCFSKAWKLVWSLNVLENVNCVKVTQNVTPKIRRNWGNDVQQRSRRRPEPVLMFRVQHQSAHVQFLVTDSVFVKQELKDQIQECEAQNKDLAHQTISGIRSVRSFKAEKDELRRYTKALDHMCDVKRRSGIYSAIFLVIRRVRWQRCTSRDQLNYIGSRRMCWPLNSLYGGPFPPAKEKIYEK